MHFSEIFIRRPIMTVLTTVLVTIFGVAAYLKLPISDLPVVDSPVIVVTVGYPGASAATMASTVASPLENQFAQIPGIERILSTNTEGQSQITLTFELDRSVDLAAPDVQAAITRAQATLPTDLPSPPTYSKTNPSDAPIIYLMVHSDTLTPGQLYDYANKRIGQRISMLEGVSQVQVWGAKTAVRIQVDPDKLASYKVGLNDISAAVNSGTVTIPGGSINGPVRAFSIEPQGQLLQAEDYKPLIIAYRNNAPIRLRDVAKCVDSVDNDVTNVMFGYTADKKMAPNMIVLAVSRSAGANTVALAERVRATIDELKKEIPGSVHLDIFHDKSHTIIESIDDVKTTIIIALILVVLVIYLFLGRFSDTVIPSVTLPLSLVVTFIFMYASKFSLDNLSLMGLTLSIGFVVDDAIVVLENTVRLIEEGKKPLEAAIESAKEISGTVVSMTLSLAVIFVPLVFMGGVIGRTFREFAITVVLAIMVSGVISLTLSPMMCARMLKEKTKGARQTPLETWMNNLMKGVIDGYGKWLRWTLKRPMTTLVSWVLCLAGTGWLFTALPKSFLPEGDSGLVQGLMIAPLGISSQRMNDFQSRLNGILLNNPNIEKLVTLSGLNAGADQSTGPFFAVLKPASKRKPMQEVVRMLRTQVYPITQGFVAIQAIPSLKVSTGGESTAQGNKYSYVITGADQDEVYRAGLGLEAKLRSLKGFVDLQNSVKLDLPQLTLTIKRDRASTLGITAQDIESVLSLSFAQGKVTLFKTDIDQYDVIVELDKHFQSWPSDLGKIYLRSRTTDAMVPLSAVAIWKEEVGPQNVPHFNQLNSATISFNLESGIPLGTATKMLEDAATKILPPGVTGQLQGEAEEFTAAIASLGFLILVAVFIKYIILGVLYESYTHPFTVLTTLPVATFGGLATLYFFKSELSLYAYVGLFMLLGIVAKNGIMMVDFANQNLEKGTMSDEDAIYEACVVRFRPILMTGLAAIMGAVPIALGFGADGEGRRPLGLIVIGGLIFSQVITLFVTPGIFLYMQSLQKKYLDRFELTRQLSSRKT